MYLCSNQVSLFRGSMNFMNRKIDPIRVTKNTNLFLFPSSNAGTIKVNYI